MQSRLNEEQILVELLDRADDWAWETCIAYAGKPHTPLVLSNEWQNCGYKQSYIGKFGFYPDGKPFVYVTYHNYKYGGIKLNFPYKEVYAEIVNNHKAGKTYTPKTRKTTQENQLGQLNLSNQPNQVNQPNQSNQFTLSNESNPSNQPTRKTMLKQALAEDQAIWDDGVEHLPYLHSYLNRKGFTENIVDPSIRYSLISANKDCAYPQIVIIVKVIGIDGELKGFQKIYEQYFGQF